MPFAHFPQTSRLRARPVLISAKGRRGGEVCVWHVAGLLFAAGRPLCFARRPDERGPHPKPKPDLPPTCRVRLHGTALAAKNPSPRWWPRRYLLVVVAVVVGGSIRPRAPFSGWSGACSGALGPDRSLHAKPRKLSSHPASPQTDTAAVGAARAVLFNQQKLR